MPTKSLYETTARAVGGRDGRTGTLDGTFEAKLAIPKELGGPGGPGNNPEQLFASGYAACILGAMKVARSQGAKARVPSEASVTATVGIGPRGEGGFGLAIALAIDLPGVDRQQALDLIEQAHHICPYSNATRGNIDVKLSLV